MTDLTPGQHLYLADLVEGVCPSLRYRGRSEAGGFATIAYSLAKRGLVTLTGPDAPALTPAGVAAAGGPRWMRGYRCHGYWVGVKRVGYVGLPPRVNGTVTAKAAGYGWGVTLAGTGVTQAEGREPTLREAKRAVEAAYRAAAGGPAEV